MRSYTIKKIEHHVPQDLVYLKDWRQAEIGDWVLADDACVIQVLRKNALTKPRGKVRVVHSLGTCTGTFKISDKILMDTEKRKDIYTFSGKPPVQKIKDRKKVTEEAKHSDKLKALFELGEILELKETNKVTEVTGALFQGFEPKQIEATQRPKLKEA